MCSRGFGRDIARVCGDQISVHLTLTQAELKHEHHRRGTFKSVRIQIRYTPRSTRVLIARVHVLTEVVRLVPFTGGGQRSCVSCQVAASISEKYLCDSCQTEGITRGCVTTSTSTTVRPAILLLHLLSDSVNYPLTPSDGKIPLCLLPGAINAFVDSSQYLCIFRVLPPNGCRFRPWEIICRKAHEHYCKIDFLIEQSVLHSDLFANLQIYN